MRIPFRSIQAKFGALLWGMVAAVALSLAILLWSFSTLDRETTRPFVSMTETLRGLGRIKRDIEQLATVLLGPPRFDDPAAGPDPQGVRGDRAPLELDHAAAAEVRTLRAHAAEQLEALRDLPTWKLRAGQLAFNNLDARLAETFDSIERRLAGAGDAPDAGLQLFQIHELIERIEARILNDAEIASDYADRLHDRLISTLAITLVMTALAASLGAVLVRRWVVRPVRELRAAADRIGRGDWAHRVPVTGTDELGQLGAEVNHMTALIEQMQRERIERERLAAMGEMTRRLAHNIRNPLSGIRSLAELTRADTDDEDIKETQTRIIRSVDRFDGWMRELLRATTPTDITPRSLAPRPWLTEVIDAHLPAAESVGLRVQVDLEHAPAEASFDAGHLEQALSAILSNAFEASPRGSTVAVRCGSSENQWWIEIHDSGPGVPADARERLFDPYFTTKPSGTGIGLAVVRQVVRAHGGEVDAQNAANPAAEAQNSASAGPGARFTIQLPLHPPVAAPRADDPGAAREGQSEAPGGHNSPHRG
ncbi:MAG: ATP-binding protein [Phycisphaerales bacterium JB037]